MATAALQDTTNVDVLNLSKLLSKTLKRGRSAELRQRRRLRAKCFC
jgi:hypothetical protein